MFDTLFGAEMPLAVRFFLAFLIVLGLIGATAWAIRRFGTGRLGANTRGRQPRLAVIDYASVDGRRRLILVRRDNVEHLLMIGGPTDVVVEPNIVRAVAAPRDAAAARPAAGIESLSRAIPLPENGSIGNNVGSWPLQPEPTGGPRPSPRIEPLPDELPSRSYQPPQFQPHLDTPARPPRDTLAALADELSTRPNLSRNRPASVTRTQTSEPHSAEDAEPKFELPSEPQIEPVADAPQETRQEARQETRIELRKPIAPPPPIPAAAPVSPAPAADATDADQSLADMAQRLEAALRKPTAEARTPVPRTPTAPERVAPTDPPPPSPPRAPRLGEPRPPRPEARSNEPKTHEAKVNEQKPNESKSPQSKSTLYDSLEQEMANLLGRQNKT
ncbi:MAG: flagellar biosynthetic protein FliO [Xanthobacteraceae bacterium]|jgi:hypothetical protein